MIKVLTGMRTSRKMYLLFWRHRVYLIERGVSTIGTIEVPLDDDVSGVKPMESNTPSPSGCMGFSTGCCIWAILMRMPGSYSKLLSRCSKT